MEGSNRWSKHYYMPAQSDRSAVGGKLHCSCSSCIHSSCWCRQGVQDKVAVSVTGWVYTVNICRAGSKLQCRDLGPVQGLQMHTAFD